MFVCLIKLVKASLNYVIDLNVQAVTFKICHNTGMPALKQHEFFQPVLAQLKCKKSHLM